VKKKGVVAVRDEERSGEWRGEGNDAGASSGNGGMRVTWEGLVGEQVGSNRKQGLWRRWSC